MTTHPPIPLAEQIAAVELWLKTARHLAASIKLSSPELAAETQVDADRLAAALATLRGLLLIEETR